MIGKKSVKIRLTNNNLDEFRPIANKRMVYKTKVVTQGK